MSAIGRKQTSVQANWNLTRANIETLVSFDHVRRIEAEAVEFLIRSCKHKRAGIAWSGGKDSRVVEWLAKLAGIGKGVFAYNSLEYPDFVTWADKRRPQGVEAIHTGLDMGWLVKNRDRALFPTKQGDVDRFYMQNNHRKVISEWVERNGIEMLIMGRRRADGNFCPDRIVESGGYERNLVIHTWSHEETLAYCHYNGIDLPPIYDYPDGFRVGTGSWSKLRRCANGRETVADCWAYVWTADKRVVIDAANHLESAAEFLKRPYTWPRG